MSFLDEVKTRRSVRAFDGKAPSAEIINELKEFAENITNPYGITIRFIFLDAKENGLSSPVLSGETLYVSAVGRKEEHFEEAYGYSFQKLLMKAHQLGLGTVWIGGTMPREKFEAASGLKDGEVMPCVSPLGVTAAKMSVKEVLMRKGVKADTRKPFEELFYNGSFASPINEGASMGLGLHDALEAVRLAPSAVNKQPWRIVIQDRKAIFFEAHDKGFDYGYDLQRVDVGIALYNFETQLLAEGRKPEFSCDKPEIKIPEGMDYIATIAF